MKNDKQPHNNIEMVQGKDIKMETDDSKRTTLTIVQEFPKVKAEHAPGHSVDFVQSSANEKGRDIKMETDDNKRTTLTIV